jgi:CubicO group peptidase (beta-lactamase class C family)
MDHSRRALLRTTALAAAAGATGVVRAGDDYQPSPAEAAAMERVATDVLAAHSLPGLSVAIARQGAPVYQRGFGFADRETGEQVTPAHLFRIASVSKPITSVALFGLVERGRIHLEDRVFGSGGILGADYQMPPDKPYLGDVRLVHLMTHTGGGWQNDSRDPMFRNPGMNHHQLIEWTLANAPLSYPPGRHYAYSNFGYCILGRVIEKVTGRHYGQFVGEGPLRQCGISEMRIAGNTAAERAPGEVAYYGARGQNPYGMNVRRMDSHGGWLATPGDLVRFAAHVDGFPAVPDILQPASIREMTTPSAANPRYAKGWSVNDAHNCWHTGSLPGTTGILVRTASGFCWAALANSREAEGDTGGALDRMMWQMVRQVRSWQA